MGVTGLWPILQPCARPIKLETLNRKRLAVDASIWIYQFLKAVRDKEGNALRNSHVVGFFRRICKLLFFGIKPVFVFDGGAPALKRQTVLGRKRRREGRRDDAVRTAGKLLAVQMQRRVEEDEEKRKREKSVRGRETATVDQEEIPADQDLVYVEEFGMSKQERQQTRKFTKKDAYHLPELNGSIENMGQPDDPRIMSAEELEDYARQFDNGEDVTLYDFSKIDFNGEFFMSLPASDRYNILNTARLRSRLRMGLSKEQLEEMFPDRMAFSRFQIERVRERNELTQRLMNLNGMNDKDAMWGVTGGGRIAGERGREYMLVKNDGVEGGWALGVVSSREDKGLGERNKPIDIDELDTRRHAMAQDEEWEDDDDFEDVPIEGLNRLPKIKEPGRGNYIDAAAREISEQRKKLYAARENRESSNNPNSMFVDQDDVESYDAMWKDAVLETTADESEEEALNLAISMSMENEIKAKEPAYNSEDEALNLAIAMSLESQHQSAVELEDEDMEFEDVQTPVFQQRAVEQPKPLTASSGKMVAHIVNNRANAAVPKRKATSNDSDDDMDLQAILASSGNHMPRASKRQRAAPVAINSRNPYDGPLPFEKLNFKTSLFDKNTVHQQPIDMNIEVDGDEDEMAGGFHFGDDEEAPKPLPPWMVKSRDIRSDMEQQRLRDAELNAEDRERAQEDQRIYMRDHGVIEVDSSDDNSDVEVLDVRPLRTRQKAIDLTVDTESSVLSAASEALPETEGDLAEDIRAVPPVGQIPEERRPSPPLSDPLSVNTTSSPIANGLDEDEVLEEVVTEWSDSDPENWSVKSPKFTNVEISRDPSLSVSPDDEKKQRGGKSASPLFEDVEISDLAALQPSQDRDDAFDLQEADIVSDVDFDEFSDPEDEELLAQLATEAEEHARFASTLNNKSEKENQEAYERELKALRTQQKKDRRDADEVSHIMITECQTLLRLFGIPYITAPMEAEAQCAELVRLGLVDGIVTDDSDCLLFDGTRVYKNMFNSNKFVECYLKSDIEKELTLSRHQLISIAHLLGSDYTEGLPGIGPVTALEILSEFPSVDGLQEFKDWWSDVQSHNRPKEADASSPFRKKFRRTQATKLFLPSAFPSLAVTDAYLNPDVDRTPEPFQWGVPDLDNLRAFLMATIGWTQERTDEVLVPVIKDMNRRETEGTQSNITRYFEGGVGVGAAPKEGFAPRVRGEGSTRMKEAVKKLRARSGKSGARPLDGTFGDEAVRWAKRNELSAGAQEEMQRLKKAGRGKAKRKNKSPMTRSEVEETGEDVDGGEVHANSDNDSEEEYRESGMGKGKPKLRKRTNVSA